MTPKTTPHRLRKFLAAAVITGMAFGASAGITSAATSQYYPTTSVPAGAVTTESKKVRVGTYNVKHSTSVELQAADMNKITKMVDTLSIQETMWGKGTKLAAHLATLKWGYYRPASGLQDGRSDESAVAWDNTRFVLLKSGYKVLNTKHRGGYKKPVQRLGVYVLLQDRETKLQFWQISAHTVVKGAVNRKNRPEMLEQYNNLRILTTKLRSTGYPVFLTGDLNNQEPMPELGIKKLVRAFPRGIDMVYSGPGVSKLDGGREPGQGFGFNEKNRDPSRLNSDHPLMWGSYLL